MAVKRVMAIKRRRRRASRTLDAAQVLQRMCSLPEDELANSDIALTNLKCAMGLPYAEDLDLTRCLDTLQKMARHVRHETKRNLHRFHSGPEEFDNSEAYWTACMMITVLQQDCGVRYSPERIRHPDFRDSRDLFIHGILFGNGGTCASMPALYVAIGRRLSYPLKLVHAKGHTLARWDDPEAKHWHQPARFNMEASGRGLNVFPDEYYHTWPMRIHDWEIAQGRFLYSLSPREEVASFLAMRGHCLQDTKRFAEAAQAYRWAAELDPRDPFYRGFCSVATILSGMPVPSGQSRLAREAVRERTRIEALSKH